MLVYGVFLIEKVFVGQILEYFLSNNSLRKKYLDISFDNLKILASFLIFLNLKNAHESMRMSGKDLKPILSKQIWVSYTTIKLHDFT